MGDRGVRGVIGSEGGEELFELLVRQQVTAIP
jgi:hypothetical protein